MIRYLYNFLSKERPVEVQLQTQIDEAVKRLREGTRRCYPFTFRSLSDYILVGYVSKRFIGLSFYRRMNGWRPKFYGRFVNNKGMTILVGKFKLPAMLKVFCASTILFAFLFMFPYSISAVEKYVSGASSWTSVATNILSSVLFFILAYAINVISIRSGFKESYMFEQKVKAIIDDTNS